MSYSSRPLTSKLFQLTSLTCALALAGCGGGDGDTVDSIAPPPDLGVTQPGTGDNGNTGGGNNGGEQEPGNTADFTLQQITVNPTNIELSDKLDEPTMFTVTVKAIKTASFDAMSGQEVSLRVEPSKNSGALTIEGQGTLVTDSKGDAVYQMKLNPQAVADEAALLKNGFTLTASATKADGTVISQVRSVPVFKQGSGEGSQVIASDLNVKSELKTDSEFSVSNNILNVSGDTATFSVIVEDKNNVRVEDVAVGLGLTSADGVSIIGGNGKKTDANGIATFSIKVDGNLTAEERDALIQQGVTYTINIKENNGATKTEIKTLPVALPTSDYALSIIGSSEKLNAYGDTQQLIIAATAINEKVPTQINGAKVSVQLNNAIDGVSLASSQLTLDAKGKANVNLVIAPTLDAATRQKLAEEGISYTVTLSEPNRSTTVKTFESSVYIPTAAYQINFNESNKKQVSSSGDTAVISFRVNNKDGGAVADQEVIAKLPNDLVAAGVLTLEGNSKQITNNNGEVSYTIRIPRNLTDGKKTILENAGSFLLTASMKEPLGITSEVNSEAIRIGSDIGKSDITLTATAPRVITTSDETFKLQVAGKRADGSAAAGRDVKLVIDNGVGVTVVGNEKPTNASGIAEFTIRINQNLTPEQVDALATSGITYTTVLTDNDGTQSKITQKAAVQKPATSIQFGSIVSPSISQLGGTGKVNVALVSKQDTTQAIKEQEVTIKLDSVADTYGVTVTPTTQKTDFNGQVIFTINVPANLTAAERADLKNKGISYQLSYVENGVIYEQIQKVQITTPTIALNVLNAPTNINNRAGYTLNEVGETTTIQAQLSNQTDKTQIASQPVELEFTNKALARLLTVNGSAGSATVIANTDANGIVRFEVTVPSNLEPADKQALRDQILTATLTEALTNQEQEVNIKVQSRAAVLSLLSSQSEKKLNLNGGDTQIEVIAEDDNGNVVAGQKVFLALPAVIASQGVTLVSGGSQTTDDSGRATFTIAVPNDLTDAQKDTIGNSFFIALSAADRNNTIITQASNVTTVRPSVNGTQENLTIGANKVVNTKGDTFKVFVRVAKSIKDDVTNEVKTIGIANREVRLNVDDPIQTGVTVTNNTATTNGDGVATFDLKLEDGANVNQAVLEGGIKLTATTTTAENTELVQNYIVAVDTATIDSYQIIASSDKSTLNTGGDQTNATIRVTDSKGGILAGVPVQLTIENLEASGAALTTPSMVTTDANGQIDVGVLLAANSINARLNHSVVINAKIVTPQYDANGDVSMQVREEKSLSLSAVGTQITLSASETKLQDGAPTTITTTLIDGAGRAIANAAMELVNEDGDVIAASATATTNADGKAVFAINEADLSFDSNGNLRVFARALGENSINTQRSLNSIDLVKVSQAGISFINIADIYNVDEPQEIQIQIRADNANQANSLIGKQVELQTSLGSLITSYISKFNGEVVVSKPIKSSDIQDNVITVKFWLKSELAGTAVLQAKVLGENLQNGEPRYQTTVDTRFRATTPAKMLFQAVKSVITPGGSTEIVATVKDKNDVPVEGQTVVFSRAADSSAGRLSAATAITDSKGEARVVYKANASSPIGGVIINARLLDSTFGVADKTTTITVSEEAVYTTLAFSNKLASDDIYYTVRGSISVMDGSGRAVPNKEVSIKSYAIEYAQGKYCLLDSTVSYQASSFLEDGNIILPALKTSAEKVAVPQNSGWIDTEDGNYNYTLDNDPILNEDKNNNGSLEAINPVAIIGGIVSDDGYSFMTDDEGRADFEIRYPLRYSNWVKVRFDATTFLNGSENTQSINYQLPSAVDDLVINGSNLTTPWIDNASPFGTGGATCVDSMNISIQEEDNIRTPNVPALTRVTLSPYSSSYSVSINGNTSTQLPTMGFNTYIIDFNQAFALGSVVSVSNNGFSFNRVIKAQ
ncbi:Ig-like domain-containing protein [Psychrobacter sp. F1192]|uniref:Ig-like domain-containing protein n=1 Tax=Psychrobacter coccoides TaxID=2818440 RepID=A0ABS3NN48_9GAMM|nr:Ig-like domain-containing protein [Psychrobacter coccoides]MBO1530841.1 Ig-like domain-containing protein [Psychrobacter coccoides]